MAAQVEMPSESGSEMDSLYSEPDDSADKPETPEQEDEGEEAVEPHTELVSKKLLKGRNCKPGDRVTFTVVKDYGDEVELKCEKEKSSKPEVSEDEELEALTA